MTGYVRKFEGNITVSFKVIITYGKELKHY